MDTANQMIDPRQRTSDPDVGRALESLFVFSKNFGLGTVNHNDVLAIIGQLNGRDRQDNLRLARRLQERC